jgi:hypothetical protein
LEEVREVIEHGVVVIYPSGLGSGGLEEFVAVHDGKENGASKGIENEEVDIRHSDPCA